jgi:hypothetical protein
MKKIVLAIAAALTVNLAYAQGNTDASSKKNVFATESKKFTLSTVTDWMKDNGVFQNLDVSVTAGTTGIGIDVASRVHENVQLRMGYEYMPCFKKSIYFPVEVGGQPAVAYDDAGNRVETTFDRLSKMLHDLTGFTVEDEVEMVGKPTVNNFKFLVDVFPFKNKHWHVTGGFYWGPSQFAYAENSTQAMTSLLAVSMYNQLYEKCVADVPIIHIDGDEDDPDNPGMDIFLNDAYRQKILNYGRMGFHVGDKKEDGEPYVMEADAESGMVKVRAKSNSFKPYLGFGYGGKLMKSRDDWQVSFDASMMFWGGTPSLITHDGTNLTEDVENISGKVGNWVDFLGGIKVYPVLQVRFTKTIF